MGADGLWHPTLTRWVDAVDRRWSDLGIADDIRERLRRDLVTDLAQARAGGASVDDLVAADAGHFAADVAEAEGVEVVRRPRGRRGPGALGLVLAGLGGAIAGALASLATVYPLGLRIVDAMAESHPDPWPLVILTHVLAGVMTIAGGGLAVRLAARGRPDATRVALIQTASLAVGGAVALVATFTYASTTDFSTHPPVVLTEILLAVACCVAGLSLGGWVSHRERSRAFPTTE